MSFSSLIWGQSQFDEAIEKATSELRLGEEDIALNLEISDQIRSKSVPPKDASRAFKRRLNHKNPNVQLLVLGLLDVCVKNGGDHFLNEIASKEFMDNLVSILKIKDLNFEVKNKILKLVQNWSTAFEGKYSLGYVGQVYKDLKSTGFQFPPKDLTTANTAMIDTSTAPEWIDSDVCLKCRDPFTFMNRKHHCRNCGGVFDHSCSSKTMPLPHFGISQDVRVCDSCHVKLNKNSREKERPQSVGFARSPSHPRQDSFSRKRRSVRDFSDGDIQRAIQLSLQDVPASSSKTSVWDTSEPPLYDRGTRPHSRSEEDDAELQAAIRASLREVNAPKPSAPITSTAPMEQYNGHTPRDDYFYSQSRFDNQTPTPRAQPPLPPLPNHDLGLHETDAILTFSQTVHDARSQGNSDLSRIHNIHDLYSQASGLRPKLALSLDDTGRKEEMLSEMHEKLSEAVKLYDNILSEQLSRPRWRSTSGFQSQYTPMAHLSVSEASPSIQSTTYVSSPPPVPVLSTRPSNAYSEFQNTSVHTVNPSYQPLATSHYNTELYQGQPYQQPASPVSYSYNSSSLPERTSHPQVRWSPSHNDQYQSMHGTLGNVIPFVSYSQAQLQMAHPIASSQNHAPDQPQAQEFSYSVAQQQRDLSSSTIPTLSRHNTLSQAPSVPFTSPSAQTVVSGANSNLYHNVATSQDPNQQSHKMPSEFPSFPTAPTLDPVSTSMYSPPVGFEKPEPKEVLLIDL